MVENREPRKIVFELCAETIDACLAAREGGANRIELCSALSEGGLTPSHGLLSSAVAQSGLPVHVLIRPRGGDFVYSAAEIAVMHADIEHAKLCGASGVVLGILRSDATVDVEATRTMVELARPMEVTFHRAFDVTASLPQALEDVIASGCERVLTSGGERDVMVGAQSLAALVEQAAGRIEIAVGGGLRIQNAASLSQTIGAQHFHGSLRRKNPSHTVSTADDGVDDSEAMGFDYTVDAEEIRTMIDLLQSA
jgi:copper homeostasis protein